MATFSGTEVSRGVPNSATAVASLGDYLVAFRVRTSVIANNVFTVLHVPSGNVRMFRGLDEATSTSDGVVGAAGRVWTTRSRVSASTRLWSVDPVTGEVFGSHGACGESAVWVGGRVWTNGGPNGPRGWSPTAEDWVDAATSFGAIGAYDGRLFGRSPSFDAVVELNPSTGAVVATHSTTTTANRITRGATIGDDIWWPSTPSTTVDMLRFNVTTGQLHLVNATPPGMPNLITIVAGPDGNIWSLLNDEIVVFNPDTLQWASGPVPSTRTPWAALTFHDGSPWLISPDPATE